MSITVHLDLPDALAEQARAQGLLESAQLGDLLSIELRRRKAASDLQQVLGVVRVQEGDAMTPEEISAEIKAARAERRAREAGH